MTLKALSLVNINWVNLLEWQFDNIIKTWFLWHSNSISVSISVWWIPTSEKRDKTEALFAIAPNSKVITAQLMDENMHMRHYTALKKNVIATFPCQYRQGCVILSTENESDILTVAHSHLQEIIYNYIWIVLHNICVFMGAVFCLQPQLPAKECRVLLRDSMGRPEGEAGDFS